MGLIDEKEFHDLVTITGLTSYLGYEKVLFDSGLMKEGMIWEPAVELDAHFLRGVHGELLGKVIVVWTGEESGNIEGSDIRLMVHPIWAKKVEDRIKKMQSTNSKSNQYTDPSQCWRGNRLPRWTPKGFLHWAKKMGWKSAKVTVFPETGNERMELQLDPGKCTMKIVWFLGGTAGAQGVMDGWFPSGIMTAFDLEWDSQLEEMAQGGGGLVRGDETGNIGGGRRSRE
jgi:hypothetical protein